MCHCHDNLALLPIVAIGKIEITIVRRIQQAQNCENQFQGKSWNFRTWKIRMENIGYKQSIFSLSSYPNETEN